MRVLIVDDEAPARARLRQLLGQHAGVQIVGQAADGHAALRLAAELPADQAPELLLLDIQMPGISGLDLAASWPAGPQPQPALVFVTAYDQHALRAFEVAACDYLSSRSIRRGWRWRCSALPNASPRARPPRCRCARRSC